MKRMVALEAVPRNLALQAVAISLEAAEAEAAEGLEVEGVRAEAAVPQWPVEGHARMLQALGQHGLPVLLSIGAPSSRWHQR